MSLAQFTGNCCQEPGTIWVTLVVVVMAVMVTASITAWLYATVEAPREGDVVLAKG